MSLIQDSFVSRFGLHMKENVLYQNSMLQGALVPWMHCFSKRLIIAGLVLEIIKRIVSLPVKWFHWIDLDKQPWRLMF